ncbi:DUF134 domain-containing protein [Ancylomarina longa]|uniref:UPF0251 protein DLK05_09240 n=1 Tax=Ancylomarina longa TaxID=2487017 RepID=A0A434AUW1_9BACT|nr:DUF134 domain-containing protein [Ancylomarina longa]RUT78250.1 DUF134 domain-containing protein [Ancylomarina longa]
MPRKKCLRHICLEPELTYYKPVGVPLCELKIVLLHLDEYEAIRLADSEGLYHNEAAARMNVSRQTFGRIVNEARKKIANAIVEGMAIKIEGGHFTTTNNDVLAKSNSE